MSRQVVPLEIDRSRCVLCGGPNDCALAKRGADDGAENADEPCWCVDRRFPADLLERASARDEGASCICRSCLEAGSGSESDPASARGAERASRD